MGILVLGFNRPGLLKIVLESLKLQSTLSITHVWIDGSSARHALQAQVNECRKVAERYPVKEVRSHAGHHGIERLMLDGLAYMLMNYDRILVLEDDCVPTLDAVEKFSEMLQKTKARDDVFSVYGHWFMVPSERETITRFQGWGWAAHSNRLKPVLTEARRLFHLDEKTYLAEIKGRLNPLVRSRLDVTPGRNVISVLESFFSWDSCISLVTAEQGMRHAKTATRTIFNCGMGIGGGHFDLQDIFRSPPFNMVSPEEVEGVVGLKKGI